MRARGSDGHQNVLSLIGYSHMLENRWSFISLWNWSAWIGSDTYCRDACWPQQIGTYHSCLHRYCLGDSVNALLVFSGPQGIEP